MCRIAVVDAGGPNVCAFLDMLAVSELGARLLLASDDGYDVIVGSTADHPLLVENYDAHPNRLIPLPKLGIKSSAAGRYQFLRGTWVGLATELHLRDFSPVSQDRGCIQLLRECRAFTQIVGGNIEGAMHLARKTWASLPGAGYGQHENSASDLLGVFDSRLAHYRAPDFTNVESGSSSSGSA